MDMLLIKKFLKKQCNEEELQQVYRWLNDPDHNEEVTALLKNSWHQVSDKDPEADVDLEKLRYRILDKLNQTEQGYTEPVQVSGTNSFEDIHVGSREIRKTRSKHKFNWLRVAAVVIILEAVAFFVYQYLRSPEPQPQYIVKTTLEGQKSTLFLNDGSKVVLNSNSTLRYLADFGATSRDLILEGEAFFDVAEDPTKPFAVKTQGITTLALGTSFNIKAEPDANIVRVSLVTGKVKISDETIDGTFTLIPGEELAFDKETKKFNKSTFHFEERISWKDGIIYFNNKNLPEALAILEKWYGVEFEVVNNEKLNRDYGKINGEFENENLANVLKVMSFAKGFKYQINGKKVVIEL